MQYRSLCIGLLLIVTGCVFYKDKPKEVPHPKQAIIKNSVPPLVIVGEGGTSGNMFQYAADTYIQEHGGNKYSVHDGDDVIDAMKDFQTKYGPILSFVYFGHGNEVGLYVNQAPHINGGLYANDPVINDHYRAASIYDLPETMFGTGSTALFYGCNVARDYEGLDSFAEQFANHFQTKVSASTGPTEFSFQKDARTLTKMPAKIIDASLYMIPTFSDKGFVTLDASKPGIAGYDDVYASMEAAHAITDLTKMGLRLESGSSLFYPYRSITAADARAFCKMIDATAACDTSEVHDTDLYRNTSALKLLLDAAKFPVKTAKTPFEGEIYFASQNNLLTHDFIHKRWYTREDMAMLTWNVLSMKEQQ